MNTNTNVLAGLLAVKELTIKTLEEKIVVLQNRINQLNAENQEPYQFIQQIEKQDQDEKQNQTERLNQIKDNGKKSVWFRLEEGGMS